jgi:hypothetical protein
VAVVVTVQAADAAASLDFFTPLLLITPEQRVIFKILNKSYNE